ncbi:sugar transferase [Georgenia satyanarayanai]|uniref:sugar transferase n=1 Tax=Georgenia satyanarayanai TaxID=860221 RepID=UPI0034D77A70
MEALKRMVDVITATCGLVATSPVIAALAVAIWAEDGGPVFFKQERIGRSGRPFQIIKLRTMTDGAQAVRRGIAPDDVRITRVGRFLRATSLDELPQLVNVLRGEMTLVGPRPTLRYQVEQYSARELRRLEVLPGLTGWAQINGRNQLSWPERIELDIWYIDNHSWRLDLRILARTVVKVLRREGTYAAGGGVPTYEVEDR